MSSTVRPRRLGLIIAAMLSSRMKWLVRNVGRSFLSRLRNHDRLCRCGSVRGCRLVRAELSVRPTAQAPHPRRSCGGNHQPIAILVLDAPNGKISLDENRQAIGTNFITEVVKDEKGDLVSKLVTTVPNVQQRLGFSKAVYDKFVPPGRDNPPCKKNYE